MTSRKPAYKRLVITTLLALALVSSSSIVFQNVGGGPIGGHVALIKNMSFEPQNFTIAVGDYTVWNNTDPLIYTLWFVNLSDGSTYLLSDPILPNSTWSHTFNETVELQYFDFTRLWITGFMNVTVGVHDVALTDLVTSKNGCLPMQTVGQGYNVDVNVTVQNEGDFTETFNVTLEASTPDIGVVNVDLFGSAAGGWGFTAGNITSPGPTISVDQGEIVNLILTSADGFNHNFFVDYNGDTFPSIGEPKAPDFTTTTSYQFTANTLGTFTYYCQYHKGTMFGTFTVNAPTIITTEIGKQVVTLNNNTSTILSFTWNTTGFAKGNWSISAIADTVLGETETADNSIEGAASVLVTIPGDVDGDRDVDIFDIVRMSSIYGVSYPHPSYDPNSDADGDGDIDIFDIVAAATNYGKSW